MIEYVIKQNDDAINDLLNRCAESEDSGESKYPGMSFEQGVKAALEWVTGQREHPLDN